MKKITVSASRKYDVIIERGALAKAAELLTTAGIKNNRKICIITDENVAPLYADESGALWRSLADAGYELYRYVFKGGELHKNMETITDILNYLADSKFSRSDALIALGGGIVGDVAGFAAAAFLRGVEFVQIPTTLLATVDSSVGGKTGVNLNAGKNLAGAFWQPSLVIFDPDALTSLPRETVLDGISETVKAGFIADASIIEAVASRLAAGGSADSLINDIGFLTQMASKAIEVKRKVVEEDERDTGSRQLLNFGHTPAHAIEKCSDYSISHGHAVAIGMDIVSTAACKLGWSPKVSADKVHSILKSLEFPLACPYTPAELTAAALQDKKIRGREITLVIPDVVGRCKLKTIPTDELGDFIARGIERTKDHNI